MIILEDSLLKFIEEQNPSEILSVMKPFRDFMMKYECALNEIETKFQVLNREFNTKFNRNPVESIKTRIKEPYSIFEKMKRKHTDFSLENVEKSIFDIAGIRVICSFQQDIYDLIRMFCGQDDITIYSKKDYIRQPKENGYRSIHLIVEVPIFLSDRKELVKVEVQFRTIAMEFWASLEHKLKYKKNIENSILIQERLKTCAEKIQCLDQEMEEIHLLIGND
ncbi:MAG: GTP pyrophosphokinase [Anaeroplasmataceae bacterium]